MTRYQFLVIRENAHRDRFGVAQSQSMVVIDNDNLREAEGKIRLLGCHEDLRVVRMYEVPVKFEAPHKVHIKVLE